MSIPTFETRYFGEPLRIAPGMKIKMKDHFKPAAIAAFKVRGVEFAEQLAPLTDEQILRHTMVGRVFLEKLRDVIARPPRPKTVTDEIATILQLNRIGKHRAQLIATQIVERYNINDAIIQIAALNEEISELKTKIEYLEYGDGM